MFWIWHWQSKVSNGYNMTDSGEGASGLFHSEERRQRNRETHLGQRPSEETRKKLSAARKGKPKSAEHRRKISEGKKEEFVPSMQNREVAK